MMKLSKSVALSLLLILAASAASALPIVSVDTDVASAGVQSAATVGAGIIDVDIIIEGVDPGEPLRAFAIDLVFDPTVVDAISVVDGGFLANPITVLDYLGRVRVVFAGLSLSAAGSSGDGALATITFQTIADGTSALDLAHVVLMESFRNPIEVGGIANGSITVSGSVAERPIPEPSTLVGLATFGLAGVMLRRTRHSAAR